MMPAGTGHRPRARNVAPSLSMLEEEGPRAISGVGLNSKFRILDGPAQVLYRPVARNDRVPRRASLGGVHGLNLEVENHIFRPPARRWPRPPGRRALGK